MAVTLVDVVRDVTQNLYSYTTVKDRVLYLSSNMDSSTTSMVVASDRARELQSGMICQLFTDDSAIAELVRVKSVDVATDTATVVRGVLGSTAKAWDSDTAAVAVEPEYPVPAVVRAVNDTITGFPPDIWSVVTQESTVDDFWLVGYTLPDTAVGVLAVRFLPSGGENVWLEMRRWKFDSVNKTVDIFQTMEPGQSLKITYRAYPTQLALDADDLSDAGLTDDLKELIVLGATYRLLAGRASGRLVDTRAETPLNGQYRQADPVLSAVRQLFAMYQERLTAARERQRLLHRVPIHMEF